MNCRVCENKNDILYLGICQTCWKDTPSFYFTESPYYKRCIYVLNCKEHGKYICNNHTTICFKCSEEMHNNACKICKNNKEYKSEVCYDCFYEIENPNNINLESSNLGVQFFGIKD